MPEVKTTADVALVFTGLAVWWMGVWYTLGWLVQRSAACRRLRMGKAHQAIALNKTIALLHAVFATVHAAYYLYFFAVLEPEQRINCSESTWRSWRRIFPAGFVGYLMLDFLMELRKDKSDAKMLVHHAGFVLVALVCMAYEKGCMQYTVTLLSEASTVVYVSRWFFIATEQPQSLIKRSEYLFALLFLVQRVFVFGYGTWTSIRDDPDSFADRTVWQFTPTMYILGYFLQLWWMYEIVMMAARPPRPDVKRQ
jgi:hypothetical protein